LLSVSLRTATPKNWTMASRTTIKEPTVAKVSAMNSELCGRSCSARVMSWSSLS